MVNRFKNNVTGQVAAIFLLSFFWAPTFAMTQELSTRLGPMSIMAIRFWIAAAVLMAAELLLHGRRPAEKMPKKSRRLGVFLTLCIVAHFVLANQAVLRISDTESLTLSSFQCVLMLLAASFLLNEPITPMVSLCVSLSGIGAVLTMEIRGFRGGAMTGYLLMTLATVSWVLYCTYMPRVLQHGSILHIITVQCILSAVLFTPALWYEENHWSLLEGTDLLCLAYLGGICIALCFVLNACGLKQIGPIRVSVLITAGPGVRMLIGILSHRSEIRPLGLVGLGFILAGIVLAVIDQYRVGPDPSNND